MTPVLVRSQANATASVLEALVQHAMLWSPVANTLHNPVHLDVTLAGEAPLPADATKVA